MPLELLKFATDGFYPCLYFQALPSNRSNWHDIACSTIGWKLFPSEIATLRWKNSHQNVIWGYKTASGIDPPSSATGLLCFPKPNPKFNNKLYLCRTTRGTWARHSIENEPLASPHSLTRWALRRRAEQLHVLFLLSKMTSIQAPCCCCCCCRWGTLEQSIELAAVASSNKSAHNLNFD